MLIAETDIKTKGQLSTYPQACKTFKDSTNTLQPERNHNSIFFFSRKIPTRCTSHSLFYPKTALRVSGVTITHLQEHKTTVTTESGNRYTVIDRVKFTDKEYR